MKQLNLICAAALGAALLTGCVTQQKLAEKDFKPLFDGKTLNGWKLIDKKGSGYFVKNGVIVCPEDGGGDLFTEKEYSDFVLRLEFKLTKGGNNGVGFRAPMEKGQIAYIGNEIQILDDDAHPNLKSGQNCGSLYRIFPAKSGVAKPVGEWNAYEITADGRHIKVVLNGQTVVDGNLNDVWDPEILRRHPGMLRPRGHIGLLGHSSHVEFRNIRVHELPHYIENPNSPPEGFVSLFNGQDLTGWHGLVADVLKVKSMPLNEWADKQIAADEQMRKDWKVEKGDLIYRGKAFNNLVSARDDYGDFELLVDWKMEPKADSGIYLRGCPQVQIWEPNSPSFDKAHPGSGGLFNNKDKRNPSFPSKFADRFVGDWNRFRILMVGNKVHVFLNNELVVDDVTLENYWDRTKPIPSTGPIELQAHTSPVHFRNVYIREIPRVGAQASADWNIGNTLVGSSSGTNGTAIFKGPGFKPTTK